MIDRPAPVQQSIRMPDTAPALIELDHASVRRGEQLALNDVTLRLPAGRHTAILGANGCGKSTLIQLITRQLYPLMHADGRPAVRVFGAHLWDVREIRTRLGIVTGSLHEELTRLPWLKTEDVLLGAFEARLVGLEHDHITPAMRIQAEQALARAQASHLHGRTYSSLSTGEARRVLVARALVHRPEALLLDEPTTGLDPIAREHLLQTLRELAGQGVALILVTHHLEEIVPEIEHVVLLRKGQVLAEGSRHTLLQEDWLSRTFDAPLRLYRPQGADGPVLVALDNGSGDA